MTLSGIQYTNFQSQKYPHFRMLCNRVFVLCGRSQNLHQHLGRPYCQYDFWQCQGYFWPTAVVVVVDRMSLIKWNSGENIYSYSRDQVYYLFVFYKLKEFKTANTKTITPKQLVNTFKIEMLLFLQLKSKRSQGLNVV